MEAAIGLLISMGIGFTIILGVCIYGLYKTETEDDEDDI